MKAIVTKYISPTDTKPSKIRASAEGVKSITVSYDHSLCSAGNHYVAAKKFQEVLGWNWDEIVSGVLPNGDYAHIGIYENN